MKDDYTTNSHYLTYTFNFKRFGRMYFLNLGVKGLIDVLYVLSDRDCVLAKSG